MWLITWRNDPHARALADRHYSRQTPGAPGFTPPGRALVLITLQRDAVWCTSWPYPQFVKRAFADAWLCSLFRNESDLQASALIREAVAVTRWVYGTPPSSGMITLIDPRKVRPIRVHGHAVWGWTYRRVGFEHVGDTKSGLLILQLRPPDMPDPQVPDRGQMTLFREMAI
jgi:hypothetical protein